MATRLAARRTCWCEQGSWRGRDCFTLGNSLIRVTTLAGGGHIAELRFEPASGFSTVNPLWIPPWKTIEPYRYRAKDHQAPYGPPGTGRLACGIVGHNICLDYFGSPSAEEVDAGLSQHGEAAIGRWRKLGLRHTQDEVSLSLHVKLPVAGLGLMREIRLKVNEPAVYFKETVTNHRKADHFFHWVQHVTLGPPFLDGRESEVALPGTQGMTFPHGYDENKALLASGRSFRWPMAPGSWGRLVDLRKVFVRKGVGFVASTLLDRRRALGYIAALNRRERLAIGYCFPRACFPWVAVWEDNNAVSFAPWRARVQARGLEFGTTPLPVPRREAPLYGRLFGVPTFACVPARRQLSVSYTAFLAPLDGNFSRVRDIRRQGRHLVILGEKPEERIAVAAGGLEDYRSPD